MEDHFCHDVLSFLQLNPEFAACAGLRLESDLAAHALDRFADYSQSDARPFVFRGGMHALEHPENPSPVFWGDADAVVLNPDPNGGSMGAWKRGSVEACAPSAIGRSDASTL